MTKIAAIPSGRVAKNSQRQPQWSVMSPPAMGPATEVTPKTAPMRPWYFPRCRAGMMSPMMVCDNGMSVPMPRPCTARPRTSVQKFGASPEITEPTMKTTSPPR